MVVYNERWGIVKVLLDKSLPLPVNCSIELLAKLKAPKNKFRIQKHFQSYTSSVGRSIHNYEGFLCSYQLIGSLDLKTEEAEEKEAQNWEAVEASSFKWLRATERSQQSKEAALNCLEQMGSS